MVSLFLVRAEFAEIQFVISQKALLASGLHRLSKENFELSSGDLYGQ